MNEYFSHDYNARTDTKLVKLFMKHNLKGIGAYWCIIEMLYEEGGYLLLNEYDRIAFELRTDSEFIKSIIEDFNLFKKDEDKFWSDTAIDRLKQRAEKSEKARKSVQKRWDKYKRNTDVKETKNDSSTSKGKESKVKETKEDKKYIYNKFYDFELKKSNNDENYKQFIDALFWNNNLGNKLSSVLKMETQVNYLQFKKIFTLKQNLGIKITDVLEQMENWKDLKKRKTVYKTFITFAKNIKK